MTMMNDPLFEVMTPLGFTVRTSHTYWEKLVVKHPDIRGKLDVVKRVLREPTEIRRSSQDEFVFLFYSIDDEYWLSVVTKRLNEKEGFLVTCYHTDKVKEGERIWHK